MKKNILRFQIISFFAVSVLGAILHFTYDWSDKNAIVGVFSAVNESTWEHLKLIFYPMLISTIIGYFCFRDDICNFVCAKAIGIIFAMLFTVVFFYTFSGIVGRNIALIDISSFFVAVFLGEYTAYKLIISNFRCNSKFSSITLFIILLCFIIFTYKPLHIGLFRDPVTGTYGIQK